MNVLILGAGMQGYAVAVDLLREPDLSRITFADTDHDRLAAVRSKLADGRVTTAIGDAGRPQTLRALFEAHDVVVSAVPYFLNLPLAEAAVAAKRHFLDMGGNTSIVLRELALHDAAKAAGVAVLPDMGLAPGLGNIAGAGLAARFATCAEVKIRVGGLPARPCGPLGYRIVFSVHGLINEYSGTAEILRDGKKVTVTALSLLERFELPDGLGIGEAAITTGGLSTMPDTFEGKIRDLDYKTVRYAGHFDKIRTLSELGLFDEEPREIAGTKIAPRAVAADALLRSSSFPDVPDLIVFRVVASGVTASGERRRITVDCVDRGEPDREVTGMMRMTAYPVASAARRLARKELALAGAVPPEKGLPWDDVRADLESRGVVFTEKVETLDAVPAPA